eukprot:GHVU01003549.1.p1 GENE.GHVU01003549.1~~GHVU01003549.1.p1  ORF type:complete len:299 (-),score=17.75 GHVU01003549.1:388-1284(-)
MSDNSSNSSKGGEILNPPSVNEVVKKKQISPAKMWCFTLNNYTDEDISSIRTCVQNCCTLAIVGKEVGKKGTPHLQGYVEFRVKCRPKSHGLTERIHWEKKTQRSTRWQAIDYCRKDGDICISKNLPEPLQKATRAMMRPEQLAIADRFLEKEDALFGRKIYWFWEDKGNWGKSITSTYMIDQMKAFEVSGKGADVLCGISTMIEKIGECPPIIIYDIPRSCADYVSYQSIEKIKDGKFFSGKYESGMVRFNKPHIICFANQPPDFSKLSADRWIVENLNDKDGDNPYGYFVEVSDED